eukprot:3824366-Rhodomonas_salina.2
MCERCRGLSARRPQQTEGIALLAQINLKGEFLYWILCRARAQRRRTLRLRQTTFEVERQIAAKCSVKIAMMSERAEGTQSTGLMLSWRNQQPVLVVLEVLKVSDLPLVVLFLCRFLSLCLPTR